MARDIPLVPDKGEVRRPAGVLLLALFLALILLPGLLQPAFELGGWFDREGGRAGEVVRDRSVQELDILRKAPLGLPGLAGSEKGQGRSLLRHIQEYEKALEKRSVLSAAAQPWVQWAQLASARQGNEKVMLGRGGWLFYRPCVEFVTGPAFSGAARPLRPNEDAPRHTDPFPAIVKFHEDLKALGIDLVLVPVPVKATICPERLAGRYDPSLGPPVNLSLKAFFRRLEEKGVAVVDLTPALWEARQREDLFLPLDSHWTPRGMGLFASALAAELKRRFPCLKNPVAAYETRSVRASNRGDLFDMLRLPPRAEPFPETAVDLEQVIDAGTGKPVESDESSPVVLLGDSAANIFSADSMKWGAHAGLAEHLCLRLQRPLHWIAVNGGAATEARKRLAGEGVAGKALVLWQFIMRDLTHPDPKAGWETFPLPAGTAPHAALPPRLEARAKVVKRSEPPLADAAEIYPDTLTRTLYEIQEVIDGEYGSRDLLAVEWAQMKKRPTRTAEYRVGDVHHLVVEPLRDARKKDKAIGIAGCVDDVKRPDLPSFWVVRHK